MTMEPTATRARTQGDKGQPFRPQRNARFERPRHMHSASAAAARVHACVTNRTGPDASWIFSTWTTMTRRLTMRERPFRL